MYSPTSEEEVGEETQRLRIELRLERLEHGECRRRLEQRARELEREVGWLRREVARSRNERVERTLLRGSNVVVYRVMGYMSPRERTRLAAAGRTWRTAVIGPKATVRRARCAEVGRRMSTAATAATKMADPSRFADWMGLLSTGTGGGAAGGAGERRRPIGLAPFASASVSRAARMSTRRDDFSDDEDDDDDDDDEDDDAVSDPRSDGVAAASVNAEAIELDLRRTHSEASTGPLREVLMQVCQAYPGPGYCQGMNFVAAFLLRRSSGDAASAAAVFERLYGALDLGALYGGDMTGLKLLLFQLERLLETHARDLAVHLARLGLTASLYATSWFVTVLVNFLPEDDAVVALDQLIAAISAASSLPPPPWLVDRGYLVVKDPPSFEPSDEARVSRSRSTSTDRCSDPSTVSLGSGERSVGEDDVVMQSPPSDDDAFAASTTGQGWAVVFRIVLVALRAVAPDLVALDFDTTLRALQDFPHFLAKSRHAVAGLLASGASAVLERDSPLPTQLARLRAQYRAALRVGVPEDDVVASHRLVFPLADRPGTTTPPILRPRFSAAAARARKYALQVRATLSDSIPPRSPNKTRTASADHDANSSTTTVPSKKRTFVPLLRKTHYTIRNNNGCRRLLEEENIAPSSSTSHPP